MSDLKQFWFFFGSKEGVSRISGCRVYNNRGVNDPQNIVDSFVEFFSFPSAGGGTFTDEAYTSCINFDKIPFNPYERVTAVKN